MFRCRTCLSTFDGKDPDPFASALVVECPRCGADRIEEFCVSCGRSSAGLEFFGNYCRDCLMQKLTYKTGHDFLRNTGYLVDFVFDRLFGAFAPTGEDPERKAKTEVLASKLFERKVCSDLICDETTVMENLIGYILDDDPMFGESFAAWIEEHEGEAV